MVDWTNIRSLFPAVETWTYINTAEGGAISKAVAEAGSQYYSEALRDGDLPWYDWLERVEKVRKNVASLLGASPQNIGFTGSVALAMNFIALSCGGKGEVLTTHGEFPSATLPWLNQGYKVNFVEPYPDGSYSLKEFAKQLTKDTKFLVCNHIGFSSGFRFDLSELSNFCEQHGLKLIVDATQSAGVTPIDLSGVQVAALMFSCYKWMNASYGTTVVYLDEQFWKYGSWPIAGWWNAIDPDQMIHDDVKLKHSAQVIEAGQPNFAPIFALGASIDLILELTVPKIAERVSELVGNLCEGLRHLRYSPITFGEHPNRSPIVMLEIENTEEVVGTLKKQKIFVSTRRQKLRISPHFYNSFEDNEKLISALEKVR